jgi:acylglycerol lipase
VRPRQTLPAATIFLLTFVLANCAPPLAPLGLENRTPQIEGDVFITRDGLQLPLRTWQAPQPTAVIIALHGMSDYSNAFDMPATWWATKGITTYAYDQRGFGRAPNRGLWPGGDVMRSDLLDFIGAERRLHSDIPTYVLGESMGGAVVLSSLVSPSPSRVDGVILVAPAIWSRADMPLSYRVALWLASHVWPSLELSASGIKLWPSDNIEMMRKLSTDPVFQHTTRADAVYGLVDLMDEARKAPRKLTVAPPVLFLYGAQDQIIPKGPTEAVIEELGDKVRVRRYPQGYHMLLRDLNAKSVWNDTLTWIASGRSSRD